MGRSKIAYLITVHKNPEQVNCLLRQLIAFNDSDVYIHVDKKNIDIKEKLLKHKNIIVLDESVRVHWGDISILEALIMLLKAAVKSGKTYEFISFRSGQDMMVRKGFYDFLHSNKNNILIEKKLISTDMHEYIRYAVKWPERTRRLYDNKLHPYKIMRSTIFRLYKSGTIILSRIH